jgi:hypothetical protein
MKKISREINNNSKWGDVLLCTKVKNSLCEDVIPKLCSRSQEEGNPLESRGRLSQTREWGQRLSGKKLKAIPVTAAELGKETGLSGDWCSSGQMRLGLSFSYWAIIPRTWSRQMRSGSWRAAFCLLLCCSVFQMFLLYHLTFFFRLINFSIASLELWFLRGLGWGCEQADNWLSEFSKPVKFKMPFPQMMTGNVSREMAKAG